MIAGHGRLAAARQLGLTEVPVVVLASCLQSQRRQLVLADNRIALNAGWDMEMLKPGTGRSLRLGPIFRRSALTSKELSTGAVTGGGRSHRRG